MKIDRIEIRNFRRLENVQTAVEERETVLVGPNNSGKTSATAVFRCFLGQRRFRVYDFSVSKISEIDKFGAGGDADPFPSIELDIWFRVDPDSIEFGRAFTLLPNLNDDFDLLGVRMIFGVSEPQKLHEAYLQTRPPGKDTAPAKRLSEFLADDAIFSQFFEISYSSLETTADEVIASKLDKNEGKNLLQNLIRIDFVDAQRNINDDEGHRATRLSTAFAGFYRSNLKQVEVAAEARQVIDQNNEQLTAHYETQFSGLLEVIKGLGVPSVNDRDLRIVSTLSSEAALRGNTDLLYIDAARSHELPELYNGLGFKNLIYMAIQAKHFHSQWLQTPTNRPMCHMIFIEEPEVHLHAQVQQTFISNIWDVIEASAVEEGEKDHFPQLIVTTHSSHILDATEFAKVRYFRRCPLADDPADTKILNATEIHSLRDFQPQAVDIDGQVASEAEALKFLKRYMRLTHCDLFFADAAILVEGAAEKLLLPSMIDKVANRLRNSYLTVLEIGGAYAHRFEELLVFLRIPCLVITDLDSVSPEGRHPTCRADQPASLTSNASLKHFFNVTTVEELNKINAAQRVDGDKSRCVVYQLSIEVDDGGEKFEMLPRTFEEAISYQNFASLRNGNLSIGIDIPQPQDDAYEAIYTRVKSSSFKKTDFAMGLLASDTDWQVPNYVAEGLKWLEVRLHGEEAEG